MLKILSAHAVLFVGFLAFASVGTAQAETITRIVTVETDAFPGLSALDVVRDDAGKLTSMIYRGSSGNVINLKLAQLKSGPQVIKKVDDRNVIFLSVERDFNEVRGGHANMRFLYSGVSDAYRNFRILLEIQGKNIVLRSDPDSRDPESDENAYTSVFNYLFLQKNTFWGRTVGIEKVIPDNRRSIHFFEFFFGLGW